MGLANQGSNNMTRPVGVTNLKADWPYQVNSVWPPAANAADDQAVIERTTNATAYENMFFPIIASAPFKNAISPRRRRLEADRQDPIGGLTILKCAEVIY